MGKGKPKWKSLPSRERFARKVKSWGFSDSIVNRIRESNNKDTTDKSQEDKIMKEFEKLDFDTEDTAAIGARAELLNVNKELQHEPDYANLGYWIGIRTGIKAFVNSLECTAERLGEDKLPIELIKLISANTIMDTELKLSGMKHGRELINAIDDDQ